MSIIENGCWVLARLIASEVLNSAARLPRDTMWESRISVVTRAVGEFARARNLDSAYDRLLDAVTALGAEGRAPAALLSLLDDSIEDAREKVGS